MGYTTEFKGEIAIDPPLTLAEYNQVNDMQNDERWRDKANDMPYGWCGWESNRDGTAIRWNEQEQFYYSDEWMQWLIDNIICKDSLRLINGEIHAQGEEMDDKWILVVENNKVTKREFVFTSKMITCPSCECDFYIEQAE